MDEEKKAAESPASVPMLKPRHFIKEAIRNDPEAFCEVLRSMMEPPRDSDYRYQAYRQFNRLYNQSLQSEDYETAVICLMLMRSILREEGAKISADTFAQIAMGLIRKM